MLFSNCHVLSHKVWDQVEGSIEANILVPGIVPSVSNLTSAESVVRVLPECYPSDYIYSKQAKGPVLGHS